MANEPEKLNISPENNLEQVGEAARERHEQLERGLESAPERSVESAERQAERARVEALESAVSVEAGGAEKKRDTEPKSPLRHSAVSKKDRQASYNRTMKQIRSEMPAPARAFSKTIHNPVVERVSDVAGATVARPNAMLAGAVSAFIVSFALYIIAKRLGYPLSGFETIGAFIAGWILGLLFDYVKLLVTGKK